MTNPSTFVIYNASAGSGKTFTLVKEYLKILFRSSNPNTFKSILAITFTNKASGEMKSRIIDALVAFSKEPNVAEKNPMFNQICNELNISKQDLKNKSSVILNTIIYNYAAFDISTIDGFVHKLIKTFAYDLKLPLNFEVELDSNALLTEAVDRLISKAGSADNLTKVLVDYAVEKADDDKSWDISKDLYTISKLLLNENDIIYLKSFENKSLEDFQELKKIIVKDLQNVEHTLVKKAEGALELISESGLKAEDFKSKYLPNYFENLKSKKFNLNFDTAWQSDLISGMTIYPKKVTGLVASIIESIQSQLATSFTETKALAYKIIFLKALYKNITPLSVLNEIRKELITIKDEKNVILISEFNSLISEQIKDQPSPFIYERLGERFKYYFIDEFQDTSQMQWENLIPLIGNALASENSSAMIVGDAKQAIYRWRGGKAEQFIDLFNKSRNPFFIDSEIVSLESNYRSRKTIVEFNNKFFDFLAEFIFRNTSHKALFKGAKQIVEHKEDGYVSMAFLSMENADERDLQYAQKTYDVILDCFDQGYLSKDICVLVRKKKEGIAIAEFLSSKGIKIMSSETLLINNSVKVRFINNILNLLVEPEDIELKAQVLNGIITIFKIENKHTYLKKHLALDLKSLFRSFESLNCYLDFNELAHLSLYDLVETIVRSFSLITSSDAYIQYYLDEVLEFSNRQKTDIKSFLEYFETKADKLSIVAPEGFDALQIMTIHKSKGLEFPVVIFPYADLDIYKEKDPTEWIELESHLYNGFSYALLNYSKVFENFGEAGAEIYHKHQSELELDNVNLLYVALTRPVDQLHIISKLDMNSGGVVNKKTFAGFFILYLQENRIWDDQLFTYEFGAKTKKLLENNSSKTFSIIDTFVSNSRKENNIFITTNSGYLWDTAQKDAIEKGNLVHNLLSKIKTINDIEFALNELLSLGKLTNLQALELKKLLNDLVSHPILSTYFSSNNTIYIEQDIVAKNGLIIRPDRLVVLPNNTIVLIDYKSGNINKSHELQLLNYENVLNEMGFEVIKKILVYINEDIQIKEF